MSRLQGNREEFLWTAAAAAAHARAAAVQHRARGHQESRRERDPQGEGPQALQRPHVQGQVRDARGGPARRRPRGRISTTPVPKVYHVWPVATCLWAGRAAKPTLEGVVITCYHFSDTLEAASCCQFLPVSASCCQFSADSFQFPQWPFLFPVALEKSAHYSYHSTHLGPK